MGAKEERHRQLRRRLFKRDGWQDDHGDWFAMCSNGCGAVISWHSSYKHKVDPDDRWTLNNSRLVCRDGGCPQKAAKAPARDHAPKEATH